MVLKESNKTRSNAYLYISILLCICDPCFQMFLNVAKKIRTLSYAKKSQLNSVASWTRFSKDRLESLQKHIIKRHLYHSQKAEG